MEVFKITVNYSIVTNIDVEHMDYYKNYKNLENSFIKFINKNTSNWQMFLCIDNKNIQNVLKKIKNKNILTYGFSKSANYRISNARYKISHSTFDLHYKDFKGSNNIVKNINLKLLGKHNVLNASATIALCLNLLEQMLK